jgi:hypothetical protein
MKFELDDAQKAKLAEWEKEQDKIAVEMQRKEIANQAYPNPFHVHLLERDEPYYGATGGVLTYKFTPTSIGEILVVKHSYTNAELDLTDYDSW